MGVFSREPESLSLKLSSMPRGEGIVDVFDRIA